MSHMVAVLDDWGRPAWIALMVVGFIVFWPVGLAILAYLIWSGRMGCRGRFPWSGEQRERWERKMNKLQERMSRCDQGARGAWSGPSTGNRAFDEYRAETLKRLEDEATEFKSFLERLRLAKDKAEFDQFMAERRSSPPASGGPIVPTSPAA